MFIIELKHRVKVGISQFSEIGEYVRQRKPTKPHLLTWTCTTSPPVAHNFEYWIEKLWVEMDSPFFINGKKICWNYVLPKIYRISQCWLMWWKKWGKLSSSFSHMRKTCLDWPLTQKFILFNTVGKRKKKWRKMDSSFFHVGNYVWDLYSAILPIEAHHVKQCRKTRRRKMSSSLFPHGEICPLPNKGWT